MIQLKNNNTFSKHNLFINSIMYLYTTDQFRNNVRMLFTILDRPNISCIGNCYFINR